MPSNLHMSITSANNAANNLATLCNNGYIDIYATTQPSTPETAAGGTALATFQFGATAFGSASSGVITANAIASVTIANTGTAVWFRVTESDHATPLWDGACGTSGSDMNLNATSLVSGATLSISSLTFTVPGV